MNPKEHIARFEKVKTLRSNWETQWQDAATYCLPTKAYVNREKTSGEGVGVENYDATARNSVNTLAAALHSYLTNPASKWFSLRTKNKAWMSVTAVKRWLKSVEDKTYDTLNSSNFAQQVHEAYIDLATFGTAILYEESDAKDYVRFYCRPIRESFLCEGEDERVDTVYRSFKITARQAFQRWGKGAGQVVNDAIEKNDPEKEVEILHVVMPRYERDSTKADSQNMPYASTYIEISRRHLISEGGYKEFPFFTPRFSKLSGDQYGFSPAMVSMPDIKMLNAIMKTLVRAGQKIVDPPIILPHDGYLLPLNLNPGGNNYKLQSTSGDVVEPLLTHGNIPVGFDMVQDLRALIQKSFFVDVFLMLAQLPKGKDMTATEVSERAEEKMLILGPVLGRLMNELLNPLIVRTIRLLMEQKQLELPPDEIANEEVVIEYISPLAKAQKFQESHSISNLLTLVAGYAQFKPEILDKIKEDKLVDDAAEIYGVNPEIIRDDDEVAGIRQKRQAQQDAAAGLQAAQMASESVRNAADAQSKLQPNYKGVTQGV